MWAAISSALAAVIKELVSLWWKRANEPSLSTDAKTPPGNAYQRFLDRVRRHKSGVRPPS
jgi:hypothetical protein